MFTENKAKNRWDSVQTMIDAKCALKHLFELVADFKSKATSTEFKLEEIQMLSKEQEKVNSEKLEQLEAQIEMIENKYSLEITRITKENEEKVAVLVRHLSGKEHLTNDESLKERLQIQAEQLEKMSEIQDENDKYKEQIEHLKLKINEINDMSVAVSDICYLFLKDVLLVVDNTYILNWIG